jgi:hypothetical protein
MKMTRECYIPKSYKKLTQYPSCGEPTAIVYGDTESLHAAAFGGKRAKPDWHYSFRTKERMQEKINEFLADAHRIEEYKKERAAKKKAHKRGLKVGDMLMNMWGYDQTNIDYFQVTKLVGKCSVEIREIGAINMGEDGFMTGKCKPNKDNFVGEPMLKRVGEGDSVKIHSWGSWAHKTTEDSEHRWSSYA